jgi:tetratricopeptide (TPR) repeat protein
MEMPDESQDAFLDLIDDRFSEESLFEDLGYRHPGFQGQLIYRFSNPVLRSVILGRVTESKRLELASNVLIFLEEHLPVSSRRIARLFLKIASQSESEDQEKYRLHLAWWIGLDEASELTEYLKGAMRVKRLTPDMLLDEVQRNLGRWAPYKTLAVLDVFSAPEAELAIGLLPRFYYLRASARCDADLYVAALDDSLLGLSMVSDPLSAADFHSIAGKAEKKLGVLTEAVHHIERALALRERLLGDCNSKVADSLCDLAKIYKDQAKLDVAEPLLKRTLDIRKTIFGPVHISVADSLHNLATLYQRQDKLDEAEPLMRQALDIQEKELGPEHHEVAVCLNNLALICEDQSKLDEAERLLRRALEIDEKVLGPEHTTVGVTLHNLAVLYRNQGKLVEAESLMLRGTKIQERVFGLQHPHVALSLTGLAVLYLKQDKVADAESLIKRALDIQEKTVGARHTDVAISLGILATVYLKQGKLAEAESLMERAIEIDKTLAPEQI